MRVLAQISAAVVLAATAAPASGQSDDQNVEACVTAGDEAIAGCTAAIESGKRDAQSLELMIFSRGLAYSRQNNYARAIADYDEAIRHDPQDADAFYERDNAHFGQNDDAHAIADFSEAIRLDPQNRFAFNNRGNVYYRQNDYTRAIADWSKAIRLDPLYVEAYYHRGLTKKLIGKTAEGEIDIARARLLDPDIGK